ncbi:hypothetical protein NRS6110_04285 [Bacillus subtilis]|nr:hypothetical protein NRS6110_04285 [Bacillus subtilis]
MADMAKRVSCPLPLVSRIFRKAQPVRQGRMPGIRWRTWPSTSAVPCRWYPGSTGMGASGAPGQDTRIRWRTWPSTSAVPCRWYPGSSGRRSRCARAGCQEKVADMAKRVSCPLPLVSRIFRKAHPEYQDKNQDKVADMTKHVSCPLPLVSRIFRKAHPVR